MNSLIFICVVAAVISVAVVLGLGLLSMAHGGELNKKYGNKLMQARVILQGLAIALLVIAYLASKN
jgi:hypothetical protein